ncbi:MULTISPECIES: vWA domain-containing protein [unclassified Butyrivibrio]|uniref:vWA domain-containing protein n=1 Tax=unclassified Butyrivibrio TaxID=2639466 RepID=UPI0003B37EBE|nr:MULTISPECIES: vWA domain-containing protein [unclassified Butyrivibrio]
MNNNLTEIVYILDRSGSMGGLEEDTIGGFNSMMEKQKKTGEQALVSTVLFDDVCEVLHDRVPLDKIEKMTDQQYYVRGCTALLDAVGGAIHHIGNVHKYAREEDRPAKTIFVITTDGMENASKNYSYDKIQKMVRKQQEKYGWEFIFIGANIDAYAEAQRLGVRKERAVNYVHDDIGTAKVYAGVSSMVCKSMKVPDFLLRKELDESNWAEEINEDYNRRGKKAARR